MPRYLALVLAYVCLALAFIGVALPGLTIEIVPLDPAVETDFAHPGVRVIEEAGFEILQPIRRFLPHLPGMQPEARRHLRVSGGEFRHPLPVVRPRPVDDETSDADRPRRREDLSEISREARVLEMEMAIDHHPAASSRARARSTSISRRRFRPRARVGVRKRSIPRRSMKSGAVETISAGLDPE